MRFNLLSIISIAIAILKAILEWLAADPPKPTPPPDPDGPA